MIDTKALRENQEYPLGVSIQNEIADELDHLYLDTTPLTREELEGVLKEAGLENTVKREHSEALKNKVVSVWICEDPDDHNIWLEIDPVGQDMCYYIPLSAVTRATLRACGVIK